MYLFDKKYQYFEEPWPHIIIENALPESLANYMADNWPECFPRAAIQAYGATFRGADAAFEEFEHTNMVKNADSILKLSAEIFGDDNPFDCDLDGFVYREDKSPDGKKHCIRDWHVDRKQKKYHGLLYIGSGPDSEFIAKNEKTGLEKTYQYVHNRFLWYRNTDAALHKFYCGVESRKTISISADFLKGF